MCGIFAVSGINNEVGDLILKGLKKLEYRGYDSWGICLKSNENILIDKNIGKISEINKKFPLAQEAIGHTRWATHGGVKKENAHPHKSGKVILVHNGVFENYEEFREKINKNELQSETDSEIIAYLINKEYETIKNPVKAIKNISQKIKGRFALVIMFEDQKGLYAVRRGSPLIIGKKDDKTFIASDILAFLEETKKVNYLDDNEIAVIFKNKCEYYSLQGKNKIIKRDIIVPWSVEKTEKGKYPHFMIKEIFEQKLSIIEAINHKNENIFKLTDLLKSCNGVYFIACGTAHKVARTAEYFFAKISGRKVNVVAASEMKYFSKFINKKTAVVAISQSGETADVLEVIEYAKKQQAKTIALTNSQTSTIARISDVHLSINAGPEKAVASTKAATSQMALCFLLAYADKGEINLGREKLQAVSGNVNDLLNPRYEEVVKKLAKILYKEKNLFIIGRNEMFPMALEAAIKIQEVSYIPALAFAAGEMKHGPIALIEKGSYCIVLGDDAETVCNAIELKARGAKIIGVSAEKDLVFDYWLRVPDCGEAQAIASIIPIQILAYYLAIFKGLDPDMPRNLAKSVTVK